jgi:hypothetical protein
MKKESNSLEENEKSWRHLIQVASSDMEEQISIMAERAGMVEKRMALNKDVKNWNQQNANASLQSALHDLDASRAAHADDNSPAVARALARVEASLISADPATQLENNDEMQEELLVDGQILQFGEAVIDENVELVDLSENAEDDVELTAEDAINADLSQKFEEQ